ncbi:MAG TPA: alpha/beta fold hydrolase [Gemmatimonadales bacterium]|nr:alpha/beta fold hydrolase [Gemmatimonadales bacterium]
MPELRAPDGASLVYDVYEPPTGHRSLAAVLWICGWSDHRTRWRAPAERLRDAGYAVYVLDQRGQGDSGGMRGHLSRFSQLLGDLQAFRRMVRQRPGGDLPHVLLGHSFGGLVVLRYLETQPSDPVAGAVLSAPWLATALPVALWKHVVAKLLADLWPTARFKTGLDSAALARDPAVALEYDTDAAVHRIMTPGAWREIQWAQRVVPVDAHRIECPLLFLLGGADRIVNVGTTRRLADGLRNGEESGNRIDVRVYAESYHELLHDREADTVTNDVLAFLGRLW